MQSWNESGEEAVRRSIGRGQWTSSRQPVAGFEGGGQPHANAVAAANEMVDSVNMIVLHETGGIVKKLPASAEKQIREHQSSPRTLIRTPEVRRIIHIRGGCDIRSRNSVEDSQTSRNKEDRLRLCRRELVQCILGPGGSA